MNFFASLTVDFLHTRGERRAEEGKERIEEDSRPCVHCWWHRSYSPCWWISVGKANQSRQEVRTLNTSSQRGGPKRLYRASPLECNNQRRLSSQEPSLATFSGPTTKTQSRPLTCYFIFSFLSSYIFSCFLSIIYDDSIEGGFLPLFSTKELGSSEQVFVCRRILGRKKTGQ